MAQIPRRTARGRGSETLTGNKGSKRTPMTRGWNVANKRGLYAKFLPVGMAHNGTMEKQYSVYTTGW